MMSMDGLSHIQNQSPAQDQTSVAVQVRGLVKSFGTGETTVTVLKGIDLDVYFGELLLLVGESGGGKTTLLSPLLESWISMPATLKCWEPRSRRCHRAHGPVFEGSGWVLSTNNLICCPR